MWQSAVIAKHIFHSININPAANLVFNSIATTIPLRYGHVTKMLVSHLNPGLLFIMTVSDSI